MCIGQFPIAPAAPPVHHRPRLRALALLGRRPHQRVEGHVIPASEKPTHYAVIGSTASSKQFRLDIVELCCSLQRSVRPKMQDACREGHRARVAECAISATHNSLKSQRARNLKSPISNDRAITSKLCIRSRPTAEKITRPPTHVHRSIPDSARRTAGAPPTAISCLGAFRTPAASARGGSRHSGVRETCTQTDARLRFLMSVSTLKGTVEPERHTVSAIQRSDTPTDFGR